MEIDILTIFPQMFESPFSHSIIKKAISKELIKINIINFREFAKDQHKSVDDYSYGGGPGMVLKPEPIIEAVKYIREKDREKLDAKIIITSAQGKLFKQEKAKELSSLKNIILICGRYEGIDERVVQILNAEEISIGDYVLTGGEIPAMVITDALIRMIPGVLGKEESAKNDSFYQGLLDYPHFTRPEIYKGYKVPEILLSGNHIKINSWRKRQSLLRTFIRRPDLLVNKVFSKDEIDILNELIKTEQ